MKDLLVLLAGMSPKELLVETMKKAITEWEKNPTDENFGKLATCATLIVTRSVMPDGKNKIGNVARLLAEYKDMDRAMKLIKPPGN